MNMYNNQPINGNIIKQVLLLIVILSLAYLIVSNLVLFVPSLLGAVTLYIIFRTFNLHLIENLGWKRWVSALTILLIIFIVVVLPIYFSIQWLVMSAKSPTVMIESLNLMFDKTHQFLLDRLSFDILSTDNLNAIKTSVGKFSTRALSTTVNTASVIASTFFILYFMLENPIKFEGIIKKALPFKRKNNFKIGKKIHRMVIANAVGIPVVALGQGLVALVGYYIFGVENPILLFILTTITAMIPIVGSMLVYVPLCIIMAADGNNFNAIGLFLYCFVLVGATDNVMRFTFLKKMENIHPLNTVFGIIVGMNLFGFIGLVFGPILVSLTILLIKIYIDEFSYTEDNFVSDEYNIEQ